MSLPSLAYVADSRGVVTYVSLVQQGQEGRS